MDERVRLSSFGNIHAPSRGRRYVISNYYRFKNLNTLPSELTRSRRPPRAEGHVGVTWLADEFNVRLPASNSPLTSPSGMLPRPSPGDIAGWIAGKRRAFLATPRYFPARRGRHRARPLSPPSDEIRDAGSELLHSLISMLRALGRAVIPRI